MIRIIINYHLCKHSHLRSRQPPSAKCQPTIFSCHIHSNPNAVAALLTSELRVCDDLQICGCAYVYCRVFNFTFTVRGIRRDVACVLNIFV